LFLALFASATAHAQKPGSYYFADADGNGLIETPDLSTLLTILGDLRLTIP